MAILADHKVTAFFNDLEMQDDAGDLELLVEAERRGLLNDATAALLARARELSLVPPLHGDNVLCVYSVVYLGGVDLKHAKTVDMPALMNSVAALVHRPHSPDQKKLVFYDKSLCLKQHVLEGGDIDLCVPSIKQALVMDTTLVLLCKANRDDELALRAHAFCFSKKRKAIEAADKFGELAAATQKSFEEEVRMMRTKSPVYHVHLKRGEDGFGFNFIGPQNSLEPPGIFITRVRKEDCHPYMRKGLEILTVNGRCVEDCNVHEVLQMVKDSKTDLVLEVQENPVGFAIYQAKFNKKPTVLYRHEPAYDNPNLDTSIKQWESPTRPQALYDNVVNGDLQMQPAASAEGNEAALNATGESGRRESVQAK
eukprot:m.127715 g.127715  ORF g.127715 m.127715 type:complete len:368 (-) comp19868_c0_seq1:122-1225(-)